MEEIVKYLPEIITALWGLFTGILLEKVNANKDKKLNVYNLRKEMYLEITKVISNIPSSSVKIEVFDNYYRNLLEYYELHTPELVLICNTKVADLFTEYIKVLGEYIAKSDWNEQNRDEALKIAQKLINKMRRKLLSFD